MEYSELYDYFWNTLRSMAMSMDHSHPNKAEALEKCCAVFHDLLDQPVEVAEQSVNDLQDWLDSVYNA